MPGHRAAVLALAASSFVYVTAETLPVGLLPQIATGLDVREATVGLLLTSYATVAGVSTLPLTSLALRVPRDRLMVAVVAVFAVAQLAAALSPTFAVLTLSRLICALAHGVFWSAIAPVAVRLAPAEIAGRATSTVFAGAAAALVLGVPLGTALGQAAGWRWAFAALAAGGALAAMALVRLLPPLPALVPARRPSVHEQVRSAWDVARAPLLARVCLVTGVVVLGHFTAFTYLAPLVRRDGGLDGAALSALLLGYGLLGLAATLVAGWAVDRRPGPSLAVLVGLFSTALVVLTFARADLATVLAVLAWGTGFSALPVCLQSAVLRVSPHAQDTASAVYVVAFQLGIGGGALLGERLVSAGFLDALPPVAATLAVGAAVLAVGSRGAFPGRVPAQSPR